MWNDFPDDPPGEGQNVPFLHDDEDNLPEIVLPTQESQTRVKKFSVVGGSLDKAKVVWFYDPALGQPVLRATAVQVVKQGTRVDFTLDLSGWTQPREAFTLKLVVGDPTSGWGAWKDVVFR